MERRQRRTVKTDGPDPIDVFVGLRIRMRRKVLGVSQSALADALELSFQQVQKYERGANRVSASMLVKTARFLDRPVSYFVDQGAMETTPRDTVPHLLEPGAIEVLNAYAAIPKAQRLSVLNLMRSIADSQES